MIWLTGKIPNNSGRIETAERRIWRINICQKWFMNVVKELADRFENGICFVCDVNHHSKSGLIRCLKLHKGATVDYYLDEIVSRGLE